MLKKKVISTQNDCLLIKRVCNQQNFGENVTTLLLSELNGLGCDGKVTIKDIFISAMTPSEKFGLLMVVISLAS